MVTSWTWLSASDADVIRINSACSCMAQYWPSRYSPSPPANPNELMQYLSNRPLERDLSLNAFGHKLVGFGNILLEIPVGRAACHGSHRAHAAIGFVASPLIEKHLARTFRCAGKQEPTMAQLAPAAIALARSPEYLMPPSAITGVLVARAPPLHPKSP